MLWSRLPVSASTWQTHGSVRVTLSTLPLYFTYIRPATDFSGHCKVSEESFGFKSWFKLSGFATCFEFPMPNLHNKMKFRWKERSLETNKYSTQKLDPRAQCRIGLNRLNFNNCTGLNISDSSSSGSRFVHHVELTRLRLSLTLARV